ncbi:MAG TPA: FAD-binding oxidoreductase [Ktedonobacter sp.]|nr:FAD-binding oxidoreductase [Ktedonobacter sp.]
MTTTEIDVEGLERDLRQAISGEVRFDSGSRALYATDSSQYRQVPIGVVLPKSVDEVIATVALCHQYQAPIVMRGGGTSLAGQGCNVAVLIDLSKYMHDIVNIDLDKKQARVQPGLILDHLREQTEPHHLTFAPDPATHNHCTFGGMIGNNSCGTHSVMGGKTVENTDELDILTYDGLRMRVGQTSDEELEQIIQEGGRRGEIYKRLRDLRDKYADLIRKNYPKIPRRVSGYNLDQLLPENGFNVAKALVGTESTCVIVLEGTVRLIYSPPVRMLLVLGYPNSYIAADHVPEILSYKPTALEGFDKDLVNDMKRKNLYPGYASLLPGGDGWLLVEFGGDTEQDTKAQAQKLMNDFKEKDNAPDMRLFEKKEDQEKIWDIRESALADTAFVPGRKATWPGWEDAAVPPDKLGNYLRDFRKLLDKFGYRSDLYGHFGQGCVHTRIDFDLVTAEGIAHYKQFVTEAAHLVVAYGGSLSGEHGDGQSRAEFLPIMFGDELMQAFREFKSIWDPDWKMNPGKIINAYPVDQNLRQGTDYNPLPVKTHFKFPDDNGSFAHATLRCVGVGKCRRTEGGLMCPSYMVTREESDTTRGRAHLLFEMLQGNPIGDGWKDEHIKDALDLCLACKGCKGDCPVNVDMATYKSEFLSHYYEGRLRPITAYTMGLIYWWAQLASHMPRLANFITHAPLLSSIVKALGGIAQQRTMPTFADHTFKEWFFKRGVHNEGMPKVILWPDTFNNYLLPETSIAAVEVLEAAGYQVIVPQQSLCCGRPLYDYGFLDQAEALLRQILHTLRPYIEAGVPVVGLEPSCVSVFRDELRNILPDDVDGQRLSHQTFLLSEFLEKKVKNYQPPKLHGKAIVHGHCHHKAIMRMTDEKKLLSQMGLDYTMLDSGCCGMAGAFGFEKDHYDVSIKAGERVLLPAVRKADDDTLIIADGFSCREQIAQDTNRTALHMAQVLQMALHEEQFATQQSSPEEQSAQLTKQSKEQVVGTSSASRAALLAGIGGMLSIVGIVIWRLMRGSDTRKMR